MEDEITLAELMRAVVFGVFSLSAVAALFLWGPNAEVLSYITQLATALTVLALGFWLPDKLGK